ncbi:hypothetical protein BGZ58_008809 [Dissophora ornata]|nr:hypothetical protein BGZ58_008809 [Dissophora ornata]
MPDSSESVSGTRSSRSRRQPPHSPSPAPTSRKSLSRQSSRTTAKARDERDEDEEEVDSEDQTSKTGSGRPPRSKRASRNGSSTTKGTAKPPATETEDEDAEQEKEKEEVSVDRMDAEPAEEPAEEPVVEDEEEIEGEVEEAGEAKITKDGELLGGREYKCRSFKMPTRGDRIYMLSMDPARVLGFRDSYLFFLRNPQLVRVNTTVEERTWMIENGMLMANFKSKLIAVVTARSIFKSFGHRIIKRGRSKVDDYYESRAIEEDNVDDTDEDGASKAGDADGSQGNGGAHEDRSGGKRKHTLLHSENPGRQVTDLNWLYESAMAVRALNSQLKDLRKENPKFLDPHTNMEQIPASKQPTRCEVTAAPKPPQQEADAQLTNPLNSTVLSIPRSIGPQVDASVKVDIKGGAPGPPAIQDPNIWAVIPEDIRKALEAAEATKPKEEENEDLTKFPLSLLEGQFQAAFPV